MSNLMIPLARIRKAAPIIYTGLKLFENGYVDGANVIESHPLLKLTLFYEGSNKAVRNIKDPAKNGSTTFKKHNSRSSFRLYY